MKGYGLILTLLWVCIMPNVASAYPWFSPYSYCGGNPVNCVDPNGMEIQGVTKVDAALVVEDFRDMFVGDDFVRFRDLIIQSGKNHNGKSLAPISQDALSAAFQGVNLNEDQQALVDLVVNTINSNDLHKVEYWGEAKRISESSIKEYRAKHTYLSDENNYSGYEASIRQYGGGLTIIQDKGSLSLIRIMHRDHYYGRPATVGHEIIGHGRSYRMGLGYTLSLMQHMTAIQVENLILRNMGASMFRDGTDHGTGIFMHNFMSLPMFR